MPKTIKTTIDGIPVELEVVKIGPASADAIQHLRDDLGAEVIVVDGNGGDTSEPITSSDCGVRVVSVGNTEKPASPEDVVKISNAISKTDAATLITNLAESVENLPAGIEFWQSRTVWVNIIAIVASAAAYFGFDFKAHNISQETVVTIITTALGIINLYLRKGTDKPINPVGQSVKNIGKNIKTMVNGTDI
jgi:hypothetical protein